MTDDRKSVRKLYSDAVDAMTEVSTLAENLHPQGSWTAARWSNETAHLSMQLPRARDLLRRGKQAIEQHGNPRSVSTNWREWVRQSTEMQKTLGELAIAIELVTQVGAASREDLIRTAVTWPDATADFQTQLFKFAQLVAPPEG